MPVILFYAPRGAPLPCRLGTYHFSRCTPLPGDPERHNDNILRIYPPDWCTFSVRAHALGSGSTARVFGRGGWLGPPPTPP